MPSIYDLKPAFQRLLRPIANGLATRKVTPNQVTMAALILSYLTGLLIVLNPSAVWPLLLFPVILFVRMVLNAIDGMIAREHQQKSAFGTFLNEMGDVLSDSFLYLPFAFIPGVSPLLVVAIVLLASVAEMTGVVAVQIGASRRYDGPMGKSDRAFAFGLMALLLAFRVNTVIINSILGLVLILLMVTIMNRINQALREIA